MGTQYSRGDVVTVEINGNREHFVIEEVKNKESDSPDYMIVPTPQYDWEIDREFDGSIQMVKASDIELASYREVSRTFLKNMWNKEKKFNYDAVSDELLNTAELDTVNTVSYIMKGYLEAGQGNIPYFDTVEEMNKIIQEMKDRGYQIEERKGRIEFDEVTKPREIVFSKKVGIPSSTKTVKEFYQHVAENV